MRGARQLTQISGLVVRIEQQTERGVDQLEALRRTEHVEAGLVHLRHVAVEHDLEVRRREAGFPLGEEPDAREVGGGRGFRLQRVSRDDGLIAAGRVALPAEGVQATADPILGARGDGVLEVLLQHAIHLDDGLGVQAAAREHFADEELRARRDVGVRVALHDAAEQAERGVGGARQKDRPRSADLGLGDDARILGVARDAAEFLRRALVVADQQKRVRFPQHGRVAERRAGVAIDYFLERRGRLKHRSLATVAEGPEIGGRSAGSLGIDGGERITRLSLHVQQRGPGHCHARIALVPRARLRHGRDQLGREIDLAAAQRVPCLGEASLPTKRTLRVALLPIDPGVGRLAIPPRGLRRADRLELDVVHVGAVSHPPRGPSELIRGARIVLQLVADLGGERRDGGLLLLGKVAAERGGGGPPELLQGSDSVRAGEQTRRFERDPRRLDLVGSARLPGLRAALVTGEYPTRRDEQPEREADGDDRAVEAGLDHDFGPRSVHSTGMTGTVPCGPPVEIWTTRVWLSISLPSWSRTVSVYR